jgi:hypothetical protein
LTEAMGSDVRLSRHTARVHGMGFW